MTLAEQLAGQAARHPMAAAARRLAAESPLARDVAATALDMAGRTASAPVVQAATRLVVDAAIDTVADAAVDAAMVAGRDVVARVVRETAEQAARDVAAALRDTARDTGLVTNWSR